MARLPPTHFDAEGMRGTPQCPECQRTLVYDLPKDEWRCPDHGAMWSGPALAISKGYGHSPECGRCGGDLMWTGMAWSCFSCFPYVAVDTEAVERIREAR